MRAFFNRCSKQITLSNRRVVFFYNLVILGLLALIAILFRSIPEFYTGFRFEVGPLGKPSVYIFEKYRLYFNAAWFGALGGVIISLKGVYDNAGNPPWSNSFNLWHLGRPFSGAATGLIAALIFTAIDNPPQSRLVIYVIAFLLGTQEARFFNFLYELTRIFVQVPDQMKGGGLKIASVMPTEGKAGIGVAVIGQAFEQSAKVKIGGRTLGGLKISDDGRSAVGTLPDLGAGVGKFDVTIFNPSSGSSAISAESFEYKGNA